MDAIHLARPWVLVLALGVSAALIAAAFPRRGRRPGAAARAALGCLAAGLLLAALAGPSVRIGEGAAAVVVAEDVSPSMMLAGAQLPLDTLQEAVEVHGVPVEPFGRADPGTDVAQGLRRAARALPQGRGGVVLLYTDGRETEGDAVRAASELASRGVPVHALLPDLASVADVRIASILPLTEARPGQGLRLQVRVASTVTASAVLRVSRPAAEEGPALTWERSLDLRPGLGATAVIEETAPSSGLLAYRAEVTAEADAVAENNAASLLVQVGPPRSVAYVHGGERPGRAARWLERSLPAGLVVQTVAAAEGVSYGPDVAVVVLDNMPARESLAAEPARRLARRVSNGGLGLLVLGGDAAFGAGGYADSPLDAVLPAETPAERRPVRLVLVIDASGSMNEAVGGVRKLTLATQAVLALRPALGPDDRVAIVAFATEAQPVSPLRPVAEWAALRRSLLTLTAGGGTRISPALGAALGLLLPEPADEETARHVLLLSDGRSEDFEVARLAGAFREAGVSVSAVATGADADRGRLGRLAEATGGRLYVERDLARLAETFLADLARARGEGLVKGPLGVSWGRPAPIWGAPGPPLPPVSAWNPTRARDEATVHWVGVSGTDDDDDDKPPPLLASWRVGIGAAAALPWPVSGASGAWLEEAGLPQRLAEIVLWLRGPDVPPDWSARLVERDARRLVRAVLAPEAIVDKAPGFVATVFGTGAVEARRVELEQVEPGTYEASLGRSRGPAAAVVVAREGGGRERMTLAAPGLPAAELDAFGVDLERLERIVAAAGGRIHATPESLAAALEAIEQRSYRPAGWHLAWAGAAAAVLLVVLRLAGKL